MVKRICLETSKRRNSSLIRGFQVKLCVGPVRRNSADISSQMGLKAAPSQVRAGRPD